MAQYSIRNVLKIFLASPGDVAEERRAARNVVYEMDQMFRESGWHIELSGWEDVMPGYSRPQAKINPDVDTCDIFLGLLWRRWGSPTGEYSSGFEEEFERARAR
jgi:Domain of unknown function (DUF4062)